MQCVNGTSFPSPLSETRRPSAGNNFGKQNTLLDLHSRISSAHSVLILVYIPTCARPQPSPHLLSRARDSSTGLGPAVFGPCPRQTSNKPLVSFETSSHRHGKPSMIGSLSNEAFKTWPLLWTGIVLSLVTRPISRLAPRACTAKDFVLLLLPPEAESSGGHRHLHQPQPLTVDGRYREHWSHRSPSTASAYQFETMSCSTQRTRSRSYRNLSAAQ